MKTTTFTLWPGHGYRNNDPEDQSGEYVRSEDVRELVEAAKDLLDHSALSGKRSDKLRVAIFRLEVSK